MQINTNSWHFKLNKFFNNVHPNQALNKCQYIATTALSINIAVSMTYVVSFILFSVWSIISILWAYGIFQTLIGLGCLILVLGLGLSTMAALMFCIFLGYNIAQNKHRLLSKAWAWIKEKGSKYDIIKNAYLATKRFYKDFKQEHCTPVTWYDANDNR